MNNLSEIVQKLTRSQRAAYELILGTKYFRAEGSKIKTFRSLAKLGLIKLNPDSIIKHDYVVSLEPPKKPKQVKVQKTKDVIKCIINNSLRPWDTINETIEERERPKIRRAAPDHTNPSREDHIHKWLTVSVETTGRKMVKVKCLNDDQMQYIMSSHEKETAQAMAEKLKVEKYAVNLFCQANDIEPFKPARKHKPKDDYHIIPPEKLRRMKRADYNGPQKKTA